MQDLLNEIPGDNPCGPDMEYEPVFQEMERAAKGKEAQTIGDPGNERSTEAEPPNWREVASKAEEILKQSKDLRAAVYLARALLSTKGLSGMASGLTLVKDLTATFWDEMHPELDPDDDNDPTMRVNALIDLGATLDTCRRTPLVEAKGLGAYGLWHMDVASGEAQLPENFEGDPPNTATIDATFMQCELEELQQRAEDIDSCAAAIEELDAFLREKIEVSQTPDLSQLSRTFKDMKTAVNGGLERRGVAVEGAEGDEGAADESSGGAAQPGISGTVQNREDVVRVIDQICEFYRRTEPSSPVPMLLQRAKRLVHKDFMEIIRDLAPGGMSEAEVLRGAEDE